MRSNELRAHMARHGDTNQTLAEYLGISNATCSEKINGKRDFSQTEIKHIKIRYQLTSEELDYIFFALEVS